ncbi:MAG TPA: OsmC family protein [Anaerolineales bacterium]|jgi:putative redox protein|nr:OsmC family protein [Anaerolineales bacterium]
MNAKVIWQEGLAFAGVANKGHEIQLNSNSNEGAASPTELVALALAGCTAMDVISILQKKHEKVTSFEVKAHVARSTEYPKVFTKAELEYVVVGHNVKEESLRRAIELSVTKYCPVHAMMEKVFPIDLHYSIHEDEGDGKQRLVKHGTYQHH